MPKLNYGCGEEPLEGFVNVDCIKNDMTKPDVVCDLRKSNLPFKEDTFEMITFLHCIEHIERFHWDRVLIDFRRVLKDNGQLVIAYPEFEVCAKNFLENYKGARTYWRATLYGRQHHEGDFHVNPMRTPEVIEVLKLHGFKDIKYTPEPEFAWNTFLTCNKGNLPKNREDLYRKEVFGINV